MKYNCVDIKNKNNYEYITSTMMCVWDGSLQQERDGHDMRGYHPLTKSSNKDLSSIWDNAMFNE